MTITFSLKIKRFTACLIDLNEYLDSFLGTTISDEIGVTKLNEIPLNIMPNSCSKQVLLKRLLLLVYFVLKYVNMFNCIEIAEAIY